MSHGILVLSAAIAGISFNCAAIFILFCCNLPRVGFSRRLTVDRGWAHRLGIPPPWRKISVSENIIAIRSRTAVFTVVRLLSYEGCFFQIPNSSLYGAAGQRQIRSDRFDPPAMLSAPYPSGHADRDTPAWPGAAARRFHIASENRTLDHRLILSEEALAFSSALRYDPAPAPVSPLPARSWSGHRTLPCVA